MTDSLSRDLETRVEALGYELVELEQLGTKTRPILRLRIDWPESGEKRGVTVEDCAVVSRALEAYLDTREGLSERYTLEVSSPGVERPLVRRRDFERFAGQPVALRGKTSLAERGRRLEGELLGVVERDGGEYVKVRLPKGEEVEVPRADIDRAHLVFKWEKSKRQ
jgi:ribosome maturation factor RimP